MTEEERTEMQKTTADIRSFMKQTGDRGMPSMSRIPSTPGPSMYRMPGISRVKQLIMKAEGAKKVTSGGDDDEDKVSHTVHDIDMSVVKEDDAIVAVKKPMLRPIVKEDDAIACVKKPMMKPVMRSGVDDDMSSGLSDKPGTGMKPGIKKLSSCMSSSHVADRKPGQPAEAGGSSDLRSKIHYFEMKREGGSDVVQSGNLIGTTSLCGPRKFFKDRDRK